VGVGVAYLLDIADEHFHITDHVIAALDELSEKGISGVIEEKKQSLYQKASRMANAAAETVIDYVADEAERIFVRFVRNLTNRISVPTL